MRWVPIHAGPTWEVLIYQSRLEAEGFTTFVPDTAIGTMVPVGGPFLAQLQVPSSEVAEAESILAQLREEAPPPPSPFFDRVFGDVTDEDEDRDETDTIPAIDEVERMAVRTRWLALLWFTAPFAVISGTYYLRAAKREGRRALQHGLTMAALVFGAVNAAIFGFIIGNTLFS